MFSDQNGKEGVKILGFEEVVFSPVSKLGVLLHVSTVYPFLSMAGKSFLGFQVYVQLEKPIFWCGRVKTQQRFVYWGFGEGFFSFFMQPGVANCFPHEFLRFPHGSPSWKLVCVEFSG